MQLDLDSLSLILSNAIKAFEMLVAWSNMHLIRFGLDATTIIARGPTIVLMGLGVAAIRYSFRRMSSSAGEQEALGYDLLDAGSARGEPVYVMSDHRNRARLAGVTHREHL